MDHETPKNRPTTALSALDFCPPECLPNVASLSRRGALPETVAEPEPLFIGVSLVATAIRATRTEKRLEATMHAQAYRHLHLMAKKCWGVLQKQKDEGLCPLGSLAQRAMQHGQVRGSSSTRKTQIPLPETKAFYECTYIYVTVYIIGCDFNFCQKVNWLRVNMVL